MIIKKFQATTEKEAILMAKDELGEDAIVMNIKTIKPGGFMKLFKKTRVELTAAIDDNVGEKEALARKDEKESYLFGNAFNMPKNSDYSEEAQNAIEEKINNIARLLEQQVKTKSDSETAADIVKEYQSSRESYTANSYTPDKASEKENLYEKTGSSNKVINLIKTKLIENEVSEKNAGIIIADTEYDSDSKLDAILSNVYQKIVLKLGQIEKLEASDEKKPQIVFFVGNTGVGKTTTMAKLASKCKIEEKLKIAMLSVDTYRIAAIEQIKTYANILNTPMEVVYTPEEMQKYVEKYSDCDFIFVDTAGRSHTNTDQKNDLCAIIESVKDYNTMIYLVVSATTKYSDLLNIADTYDELFDYKLIFTKLDETKGIGNILNLKLDTGKSLSYVTWGQNVPDDIGLLNPQIITKKLLGGAG